MTTDDNNIYGDVIMYNNDNQTPTQTPISQALITAISPWEHIMLTALKGLSYLGLAKSKLENQITKIAAKRETDTTKN